MRGPLMVIVLAIIGAVFHYVLLHASPTGQHNGRVNGAFSLIINKSIRLVRLPFWIALSEQQQY